VSRNKDVDDCIREFQLRTEKYQDAIEWIPFDRLVDVKEIGKREFALYILQLGWMVYEKLMIMKIREHVNQQASLRSRPWTILKKIILIS
jgi:hypothetical protein